LALNNNHSLLLMDMGVNKISDPDMMSFIQIDKLKTIEWFA